jgi:hypothetical protein
MLLFVLLQASAMTRRTRMISLWSIIMLAMLLRPASAKPGKLKYSMHILLSYLRHFVIYEGNSESFRTLMV